jgi:hypothetical protein
MLLQIVTDHDGFPYPEYDLNVNFDVN